MKRLYGLSAIIALLWIGLVPASVSAHVLKTDGNIGAILHIDPDDNPISGKSTSYILAFKDTTSRFTLPACDCMITIQENGETISSQTPPAKYSLDIATSFTFPRPDVYILKVSGKPKQAGAFQPFELSYTIRVESGSGTSDNGNLSYPPLLAIGLGLTTVLILLATYKLIYNIKEQS